MSFGVILMPPSFSRIKVLYFPIHPMQFQMLGHIISVRYVSSHKINLKSSRIEVGCSRNICTIIALVYLSISCNRATAIGFSVCI